MLRSRARSPVSLLLSFILAFLHFSAAEQLIESKSLNPCQANSSFTATLFNVVFTPGNGSLEFDVVAVSSIQANVTADIQVIAYGYNAVQQTVDPCKENLEGLCPMNTGQINIQSNIQVSKDVVAQIPSIAYGVPDLDGLVKVYINDTDTGKSVACVEAQLSNGKTVDQKGVGWSTAIIAGLGLIASAITSGLGHSNTAAHIAANALSLFGYFQAQAMIGLCAVPLPPIVQSWTQNFDWTLGIIKLGFMQDIFTWYQRSTGGTPTNLLGELSTTSVQVQKRSAEYVDKLLTRAYQDLMTRTNNDNTQTEGGQNVVVKGIKRVAFRAGIESTNFFLTGLVFFIIFVVFVSICVAIFKGICELCVKAGYFKSDKFQDFRNGWLIVLKGILFRMTLIGYPQICILCLWELPQHDSPAEVVLALFFFIAMNGVLGWAAFKVTRIAKRSVSMHKNPAYILYSDPSALNKWGFLYVQFRATAYYFILPVLLYTLIKAIFIAFCQNAGTVQAIALVLIEAGALVGMSILRPWMDKKTNIFNISIGAINFLNAIFLLVFTSVFNQPGIVTGVMGVIFFVINAVFALVLLILVLVASLYAIFSKNPDTRYQPMRDDRGSFIKSQSQLTTELDALGATARGGGFKSRDLDDDTDSFSSGSLQKQQHDASGVPLPPSTATSNRPPSNMEPPHSPVDPSVPLFPSDGPARHGAPPNYNDQSRGGYSSYSDNRGGNDGFLSARSNNGSPAPRNQEYTAYGRTGSSHSNGGSSGGGYRQQTSSPSPWQRGAGYDH
ncbi:MAG: hypothetical protein M4579_007063 [Chaenotheca gracillima]|nr:MAG: hypothetical protein M4579_007063 [Chaenotheca gracillima]